jgi:hypothetical protein
MNKNRLTIVENTLTQGLRSHIIIHHGMWFGAEFDTIEQLDFFAQTLGFTYTLEREDTENTLYGTYREYSLSHYIVFNAPHFWKLEDLPQGAKPIKALSNGSIVTCYFTNDGNTITIYRPNPNAKEIYKPLPIDQHIAHKRIYGSY